MALLKSELSASEKDLDLAVRLVDKGLAHALSDATERDLFLLAFVEALNNAAEHGSGWSLDKRIDVAGHFRPGLVLLFVSDQGEGFTPRFPDLTEVGGQRGRGLGFIKKFSDGLLFNREGNQIAFWKGCTGMSREFKFSTASIMELPGKVVVVSEFLPRGNAFEAVGELFDKVNDHGWGKLFVNLGEVKLINSTVWGSVFAEAARESAELLVLFNCQPPVLAAAAAMGINSRKDAYAKIVVAPDFREPFLLLCQSLEQAGR